MMNTTPIPLEVCYSYADADEPLLRELEKHLSLLKHTGLVTTWHKRQVPAGSDWQVLVNSHLSSASLILLLLSANFLASEYCYSIEMQHALQRQEAGTASIIPILLSPVDWPSSPFGSLKALPSNGKPITMWRNRNAAFADVVQGVRATIQGIQNGPVDGPAISPLLPVQPSTKHGAVIITRFRSLLSYGKLRGKGIRLSDVTLFGSRIDIDT